MTLADVCDVAEVLLLEQFDRAGEDRAVLYAMLDEPLAGQGSPDLELRRVLGVA